MRRFALALVVCALTIAAAPAPAVADQVVLIQPQPRSRLWPVNYFTFGVGAAGAVAFEQSGPRGYLHYGAGFELSLGARLGRYLGLDLAWDSTYHDNQLVQSGVINNTVTMQAVVLDGRLYFSTGRVQPFVSVGGGVFLLGSDFRIQAAGPGWTAGGGADIWLQPWAKLSVKAQYRGAEILEKGDASTTLHMALGSFNFIAIF